MTRHSPLQTNSEIFFSFLIGIAHCGINRLEKMDYFRIFFFLGSSLEPYINLFYCVYVITREIYRFHLVLLYLESSFSNRFQ